MAITATSALVFTYPEVLGNGETRTHTYGWKNTDISLVEKVTEMSFTLAAGATVSIRPPVVADYDHYTLWYKATGSLSADASKGRIRVTRTNSAVDHLNDAPYPGFPLAGFLKNGDSAFTVTNLDSTNDFQVYVIVARANV